MCLCSVLQKIAASKSPPVMETAQPKCGSCVHMWNNESLNSGWVAGSYPPEEPSISKPPSSKGDCMATCVSVRVHAFSAEPCIIICIFQHIYSIVYITGCWLLTSWASYMRRQATPRTLSLDGSRSVNEDMINRSQRIGLHERIYISIQWRGSQVLGKKYLFSIIGFFHYLILLLNIVHQSLL